MVSNKTIHFLERESRSAVIDLDIVQQMAAEGYLPIGWELAKSAHQRSSKRRPTIYIDCKEANKKESYATFLKLCKGVMKGGFTASGAGHILLLLYAVGFVPDEDRVEAINQVVNLIDAERYLSMLRELIRSFNQYFSAKVDRGQGESPFNYFDELSLRLQYEVDYGHPVYILRFLLNKKKKSLPTLDLIADIHPIPKLMIAPFRFPVAVSEKKFSDFLKNNPSQIPFWGYCFINDQRDDYPFIRKLAFLIFIEDWNNTGRYIFRKLYQSSQRSASAGGRRKQLSTLFTNHLCEQFFKPDVVNSVLSGTQFQFDLMALGCWLSSVRCARMSFLNVSSIQQLGQICADHFKEITSDIAGYVSRQLNQYSVLFKNIHFEQTKMAIRLLNEAILNCEDELWQKIVRQFKKLCHEIKMYFYAAGTGNYIAYEFANHLLAILLHFPKIAVRSQKAIRLKQLFETFAQVLGYSWLIRTEQNSSVWDAENYKINETSVDIEYLIGELRNVGKKHRSVVEPLINIISLHGTVRWPL